MIIGESEISNIQLTKNFTFYELLGVTKQDIEIKDGIVWVGNGLFLHLPYCLEKAHCIAGMLQVIRNYYGKPVRVNSCFRTWEHNLKVGGGTNSQHLYFNAVDFYVVDVPVSIVESNFKLRNWHGGFKRYNTFIHLDFRNEQARW